MMIANEIVAMITHLSRSGVCIKKSTAVEDKDGQNRIHPQPIEIVSPDIAFQ